MAGFDDGSLINLSEYIYTKRGDFDGTASSDDRFAQPHDACPMLQARRIGATDTVYSFSSSSSYGRQYSSQYKIVYTHLFLISVMIIFLFSMLQNSEISTNWIHCRWGVATWTANDVQEARNTRHANLVVKLSAKFWLVARHPRHVHTTGRSYRDSSRASFTRHSKRGLKTLSFFYYVSVRGRV